MGPVKQQLAHMLRVLAQKRIAVPRVRVLTGVGEIATSRLRRKHTSHIPRFVDPSFIDQPDTGDLVGPSVFKGSALKAASRRRHPCARQLIAACP